MYSGRGGANVDLGDWADLGELGEGVIEVGSKLVDLAADLFDELQERW